MADQILLDFKSRYRATTVRRFDDATANQDGKPYFDLFKFPNIVETKPTVLHRVTAGEVGRPDTVSFIVYGDPNLFWAIAWRNGWLLPLRDITVGEMLICPALEDILAALQNAS